MKYFPFLLLCIVFSVSCRNATEEEARRLSDSIRSVDSIMAAIVQAKYERQEFVRDSIANSAYFTSGYTVYCPNAFGGQLWRTEDALTACITSDGEIILIASCGDKQGGRVFFDQLWLICGSDTMMSDLFGINQTNPAISDVAPDDKCTAFESFEDADLARFINVHRNQPILVRYCDSGAIITQFTLNEKDKATIADCVVLSDVICAINYAY